MRGSAHRLYKRKTPPCRKNHLWRPHSGDVEQDGKIQECIFARLMDQAYHVCTLCDANPATSSPYLYSSQYETSGSFSAFAFLAFLDFFDSVAFCSPFISASSIFSWVLIPNSTSAFPSWSITLALKKDLAQRLLTPSSHYQSLYVCRETCLSQAWILLQPQ